MCLCKVISEDRGTGETKINPESRCVILVGINSHKLSYLSQLMFPWLCGQPGQENLGDGLKWSIDFQHCFYLLFSFLSHSQHLVSVRTSSGLLVLEACLLMPCLHSYHIFLKLPICFCYFCDKIIQWSQ